jgi:hypothetical protein
MSNAITATITKLTDRGNGIDAYAPACIATNQAAHGRRIISSADVARAMRTSRACNGSAVSKSVGAGGSMVPNTIGKTTVTPNAPNVGERTTPTALAQVPGCLRTRVVQDTVHAVFEGTPARVQESLHRTLGVRDAHVTLVTLEDLFIEMVGSERLESAA